MAFSLFGMLNVELKITTTRKGYTRFKKCRKTEESTFTYISFKSQLHDQLMLYEFVKKRTERFVSSRPKKAAYKSKCIDIIFPPTKIMVT